MIAYTADTWTQVIVALSIFVPVVITVAIAFVFLRGARNDPDEKRLRRAQADYEAQRAREEGRRR